MKVVATQLGFYGSTRKREGEVFELTDSKHFSETWMRKLDDEAPKRGRKPKAAEEEGQDGQPA